MYVYQPYDQQLLDERVAAGLEIEDPHLTGLEWFVRGARRPRLVPRPDRLRFEVELDEGEAAYVYYGARAVSAGRFVLPALVATSGRLRAVSGASHLTVGEGG